MYTVWLLRTSVSRVCNSIGLVLESDLTLNGTILNAVTIVAASLIGTAIGKWIPEKVRLTTMDGLGLVTTVIGLQMAFVATNTMFVLGGIVAGTLIGETLDIDSSINCLGDAIERWAINHSPRSSQRQEGRFARGFVTASLLFCVGPMAIMGSFQDGLAGDIRTLLLKSAIDGFSALTLASSLGIGVTFSAVPLFIYQGSLSLGARLFEGILTTAVINDFTATGGLLVFGIGLNMLGIKKIKVANLLPSVFLAPLISYVASIL
jgi:uncharacterized membrane protein YqgA involved in biofilm formation